MRLFSDLYSFIRDNVRLLGLWFAGMLVVVTPAALFPHSGDLSTFLRVATALNEGKTLYRDIVDIKPPLVYDIVRVFEYLSGGSERLIHCMDAVALIVAMFFASYMVSRFLHDTVAALLSTLFMAVMYVSTGYASVIQSESLAILPFIVLFRLQADEGSRDALKRGMFIGIVGAIVTGLKITLGSVLIVVAIVDVLEREGRMPVLLKKWMGIGIGFVLSSLVIWRAFANPGAFDAYMQLVAFTKAYAAAPAFDGTLIRYAWKSVITYMFDQYSFAFALCALIGGYELLKGDERGRHLLRMLVLLTVFLMLTIIIERKFFPYHFMRVVAPLSILSAVGCKTLSRWVHAQWMRRNERLVIALAVALIIVWSPLARMIALVKPTVAGVVDAESYDAYFQGMNHLGMYRTEERALADSIGAIRNADEHVLVAAMNSPHLALKCGDGGWSFIAASQFALADYSDRAWQERFADEMRRARWLVVGVNDSNQFFNVPARTSMQILSTREPFRHVFQTAFYPRWSTEHFVVYEHKGEEVPGSQDPLRR